MLNFSLSDEGEFFLETLLFPIITLLLGFEEAPEELVIDENPEVAVP
jgi:hypothetical protein